MRLLRRLRIWLQRDRFESELAEELAHHRELVEKEQVEAGLSPDEAKRAAARQFGNATTASESARSIWVWDSLDNILQDIRYAWRGLARNPSLVALACLSLALSTGFGTTLFSIVNAVILQPITASQPESLVRFWVGPSNRISWLNYKDICEDTPGVACAGYRMEEASWQEKDEPLRVQVQAVTANYFELLGVQAAQGRLFDARMLKESPDTVVVTHAFWQRRLEGDPAVIGRKIILSGNPYIITAVLPQGFRSLFGMGISPALYVPVGSALRPLSEDRSRTQYELLGRLQPGDENPVSFRSRIQARGQYLEQTYPATNREMSRVQTWPMSRFGLLMSAQGEQKMMQGLLIFAGMLLIFILLLAAVACMNVAGLLIARALSRQREIAIRLSLGCSRWRLTRLLFAESFLLALLGVSAGAALSVWLARALVATPLPFPVPLELEIPIDGYLLVYLSCVTAFSTIVAGVAPAIQGWRINGIGESIRTHRPVGFRRFPARAILTTSQVALSTVLLVATMLFLRSLWASTQVNPGFEMDRVLTVEMNLQSTQVTAEEVDQQQRAILTRLRGLPQVSAVSAADIVPLSMNSNVTSLEVDSGSAEQPARAKVNNNYILPDYFRVMGIRRISGRDFEEQDQGKSEKYAIVNEAFARRLFPDGTTLGKRIRRPRPEVEQQEAWAEIIGVVADSRYLTLGEDPLPLVYWPAGPSVRPLTIHVRTESDVAALTKQVRDVVDGGRARVQPLRSVMAIALFPAQAAAVLLASLGVIAWALTIAGLYGVVGYSVTRRIPEIGVRMALGASPGRILALVMREGLRIVAIGLAIGLAAAAAGTPVLSMLLSGVNPRDLVSFSVPAIALLLTAAAAAYGPARRGTRVAPTQALRAE
jgi:predicted permease